MDTKVKNAVGLLLVGHGTTNPQGKAEFLNIVRLTQNLAPEVPVQASFLEFAEPNIPVAIDRLIQRGAKQLVAVPLMLLAANHVQQDIPEILAQKCHENPDISIKITPHLGSHLLFFELLKRRLKIHVTHCNNTTYSSNISESKAAIEIVLVARGSRNLAAQQEMSKYAYQLSGDIDLPVHACYFSVSNPRLYEVMKKLAAQQPNLIVLVPHLLFEGKIMNKIRDIYDQVSREYPEIQWEITPHIGPSTQVAEIVLELFHAEL